MSWNLKRWWRSSGLLMTSCQVGDVTHPQKHVFFSAKIILAVFFSDYVFNWCMGEICDKCVQPWYWYRWWAKLQFWTSSLKKPGWSLPWRSQMSQRFFVTEFNCLRKNAVYFYVRRVLGIFVWQILNPPTGSDTKEHIFQWDSSCRGVFWGGVRAVQKIAWICISGNFFRIPWSHGEFISIIQHHLGEYVLFLFKHPTSQSKLRTHRN